VTAEPIGDVRVQTKKVLEAIDLLLQQAGTDKSKLLTAHSVSQLQRFLCFYFPMVKGRKSH